jgi:protein-disulfide isomerase
MATDEHLIEASDARVTLVEYGDFECPYCARAYLVVQVVLDELGDALNYVFRNFPLTAVHAHAMTAAEAAESVAEHAGESAYWLMHGILFQNQDALEIDDLLAYADAIGAPIDRVASDLSSRAMRSRVERDMRRGRKEGAAGTPAFFVNGRAFTGDWMDADAFIAALRAAARERALY